MTAGSSENRNAI